MTTRQTWDRQLTEHYVKNVNVFTEKSPGIIGLKAEWNSNQHLLLARHRISNKLVPNTKARASVLNMHLRMAKVISAFCLMEVEV